MSIDRRPETSEEVQAYLSSSLLESSVADIGTRFKRAAKNPWNYVKGLVIVSGVGGGTVACKGSIEPAQSVTTTEVVKDFGQMPAETAIPDAPATLTPPPTTENVNSDVSEVSDETVLTDEEFLNVNSTHHVGAFGPISIGVNATDDEKAANEDALRAVNAFPEMYAGLQRIDGELLNGAGEGIATLAENGIQRSFMALELPNGEGYVVPVSETGQLWNGVDNLDVQNSLRLPNISDIYGNSLELRMGFDVLPTVDGLVPVDTVNSASTDRLYYTNQAGDIVAVVLPDTDLGYNGNFSRIAIEIPQDIFPEGHPFLAYAGNDPNRKAVLTVYSDGLPDEFGYVEFDADQNDVITQFRFSESWTDGNEAGGEHNGYWEIEDGIGVWKPDAVPTPTAEVAPTPVVYETVTYESANAVENRIVIQRGDDKIPAPYGAALTDTDLYRGITNMDKRYGIDGELSPIPVGVVITGPSVWDEEHHKVVVPVAIPDPQTHELVHFTVGLRSAYFSDETTSGEFISRSMVTKVGETNVMQVSPNPAYKDVNEIVGELNSAIGHQMILFTVGSVADPDAGTVADPNATIAYAQHTVDNFVCPADVNANRCNDLRINAARSVDFITNGNDAYNELLQGTIPEDQEVDALLFDLMLPGIPSGN